MTDLINSRYEKIYEAVSQPSAKEVHERVKTIDSGHIFCL